MKHKLLKHITLALLMLAAMPFAQAQVAVGDILCEGGQIYTPATYPSSGATAIGVVFYVDGTGQHGWAVALQDAGSYTWGLNATDTPLSNYASQRLAIFDLDGYQNTHVVREHSTSHPAFYAVDFDNGWYIPAIGQLNYLYGNIIEINTVLEAVGGVPFVMTGNWYYWSSSESSSYTAWFMGAGGALLNTYYSGGGNKYQSFSVRGVRNF